MTSNPGDETQPVAVANQRQNNAPSSEQGLSDDTQEVVLKSPPEELQSQIPAWLLEFAREDTPEDLSQTTNPADTQPIPTAQADGEPAGENAARLSSENDSGQWEPEIEEIREHKPIQSGTGSLETIHSAGSAEISPLDIFTSGEFRALLDARNFDVVRALVESHRNDQDFLQSAARQMRSRLTLDPQSGEIWELYATIQAR